MSVNKTSEYELTIIVPVFNEESNIYPLEERLSAFLPEALCKSCVLFVDDGSKDGSLGRIQEVCARQSGLYYISHAKKSGFSSAQKSGIY